MERHILEDERRGGGSLERGGKEDEEGLGWFWA